jgi:16S rRNA (uracil1498-N3)-methyltransferase
VSRPRLFLDGDVGGDALTLADQDHHYLTRVRRLPTGAEVEVVGANGAAALYRIDRVTGDRVRLVFEAGLPARRLSGVLTLLQPLLPRKKLELAIQKATELGVDHVRLVPAVRSVARWDPAELHHRVTRLDRIALEASRQSRRDAPPVLDLMEGLAALEAPRGGERRLLLAEDPMTQALALTDIAVGAPASRVVVTVGPEGGFDASELEALRGHGFEPLHLGPLVLRTETASVLACVAGGLALGRYAPESP